MRGECPICGELHTDEEVPTLNGVLGPCADTWWDSLEKEAARRRQEYDQ